MALIAQDLVFYLSGGASNTDPLQSIGGAISSQMVKSQSLTASTISAITYVDARGNPVGSTGKMAFTASGTTLKWSTNGGSTYGTAVNVSATGTYVLYDASGVGWVKVSKSGSLPGGDTSQSSIAIADLTEKMFDNVSQNNAADGITEYRCIYVKNTNASSAMNSVRAWVSSAPNSQVTIQMGADPAGKNGTPSAIANDQTAPAGVTFASYTSDAGGLSLGNLSAGDYYPIWIKRTVAADSKTSVPADTFVLAARFQ